MKLYKDNFVGRQSELSALQRRFKERRSQFVVIYGRRRVGKSALLRAFCAGKRSLLHVGDRSAKALQIHKVLESAADAWHNPVLREVHVDEWRRLFEILQPYLEKSRTVLVFDEFQWMCESSPELPSILQQWWDLHWEKSGNVFLVLCGSYVGFMEREVLGKKSPLFGRRTAQIKLQPFSYLDSRLFHPSYSLEDGCRVYGLCGGIPAYLLAFQEQRSVEENMLRECLEDDGALREEPRFLMMEELREPAIYFSLLECLQTKRLGVTDLARLLRMDKSNLVYYLNTLQQLGYVEKIQPLGHRKGITARGGYRIGDPLLRFWFSQVYPNLTDLTLRTPRTIYLTKIKPTMESYWAGQWERLCREAVPHLLDEAGVVSPFRTGSYWDKNVQIDLVVERDDGITHLAECKWLSRPVGLEVVAELKKKMAAYPNPKRHRLVPQIFSRSGFTSAVLALPDLQTFSLKSLYAR